MTSSSQNGGNSPASSSLIFQSIANGDPDQLSKALAACTCYSDLDVCDSSDDETPLMKAAWCKGEHKKRILQLLWVRHLQLCKTTSKSNNSDNDNDNNNNILQETLLRKDDDGFTLLTHAAFHGDVETLELVLGFYKQSFDNLNFVRESFASADLKDDVRKKLTKTVGNCLAKLPPVAVQNQIRNYYKAKAIQEQQQPKNVVPSDNEHDDDDVSSDNSTDSDDDEEETPKRFQASPAKNLNSVPVADSDDEDSTSASSGGKAGNDHENKNDNGKDNGNKFAKKSLLGGDQRNEVLTTIHCMKTLAVPLHDAMKKGKAGPTEVAKMESIMMLMGSIEEMLNVPTGGTVLIPSGKLQE